MIKVISITEEVLLRGGGKVKAIYNRLNGFSEMDGFSAILMTTAHSVEQKLDIESLRKEGTLAPEVKHFTLPELCAPVAITEGVKLFNGFPDFDNAKKQGSKIVYSRDGKIVMKDDNKKSPVGTITDRKVVNGKNTIHFTLLNGFIINKIVNNSDGTTETTDYAESRPIRWLKTKNDKYLVGKNLITGRLCRTQKALARNLLEMVELQDTVTFVDGIKGSYLSNVIKTPRALFLHAEHRDQKGVLLPVYKKFVDDFDGQAIITATNVHKKEIELDLKPSQEVAVIPHYYEAKPVKPQKRKNIITISRLDLSGKPIDECIKAFAKIKKEFPDVDYLIYGKGSGGKELTALIKRLKCQNRIKLMGYTKEPLAEFNGALASLYPTLTEGFGLSILESLSAACPVITYDVKYGPQEMIKSGSNGYLIKPGKVDDIAEAIRKVLLDPEKYSKSCSDGLERYTRQTYLNNYKNLVEKLVENNRSARAVEKADA
ncbi:glycosyltransferase [Paracoccus onubensis]|uniref:glycosyltransferase n=1 Tax=Paracoccus onubensis TaxID=1675788 RepID=UPI002730CC34|nr:glycosyltransferase [Paracoccus onubensis]MDP0925805.1 glycosyltransferase [Paracoccus onubensis]